MADGSALKGHAMADPPPEHPVFVLQPAHDSYATAAMFVYTMLAGVDDSASRRALVLGPNPLPAEDTPTIHGGPQTMRPEALKSALAGFARENGGDEAGQTVLDAWDRMERDLITMVAHVGIMTRELEDKNGE